MKIIEDFYEGRPPREYEEYAPTLRSDRIGLNVQEPCICASRGRNIDNPSNRTAGIDLEQRIEVNEGGTSNTLTSVSKDNYVIEPTVLTPKRNEYGKAVRKDYENGNVSESRHNMTELQPKTEPISNTLTSVQKDNYLIEPKLVGGVGQINWGKQYHQGNRIYDSEEIAMCLNSQPVGNAGGNSYLYQVGKPKYRIRKLTPKECVRLMDFDDSDYDKIKAIGMSDSQIYKQCGNSIIVACLEGIFRKMYIDTEVSNEQLNFF